MKVYSHDGHLFIVMTTGDIKDLRDAVDVVQINYSAEIKLNPLQRILKYFGFNNAKAIRAITFANEKSYQRFIEKKKHETNK